VRQHREVRRDPSAHRIPSVPTLICSHHHCTHSAHTRRHRVNYRALAPCLQPRRAPDTYQPRRIASVPEHFSKLWPTTRLRRTLSLEKVLQTLVLLIKVRYLKRIVLYFISSRGARDCDSWICSLSITSTRRHFEAGRNVLFRGGWLRF
jgi:hypothetical protein